MAEFEQIPAAFVDKAKDSAKEAWEKVEDRVDEMRGDAKEKAEAKDD